MKKFLVVLTTLTLSLTGFTQSEKYNNAMTTNISLLDSSKSADDLLAVSAAFERIGEAEKTQWLPYYYAAFSQVLYAFSKNEAANNDKYADKAEQLLNKADELSKNNSEVSVVRSMIATVRMLVDPMTRWQQYGQVIQESLQNARTQDPANPRPDYIQGENLKNTPEQFGGGCTTAKPVLEVAAKKFEAFKPASSLHPTWGKPRVEQLLALCK